MAYVTAMAAAAKTVQSASQAADFLAKILTEIQNHELPASVRDLLQGQAEYWHGELQDLGVKVPDDSREVILLAIRLEAVQKALSATPSWDEGTVGKAATLMPAGPTPQQCLEVVAEAERLKGGSSFVQKMRAALTDWGALTQGQYDALKKIINGVPPPSRTSFPTHGNFMPPTPQFISDDDVPF